MHDVGIVHMDLKPSNILIDKHGHLIVCDFGLSHEVPTHIPKHDYPEYLYRDNFSGQTGTIAYTAPEVTVHNFYNCKVDSWSLGMILLEMYMGDKVRLFYMLNILVIKIFHPSSLGNCKRRRTSRRVIASYTSGDSWMT